MSITKFTIFTILTINLFICEMSSLLSNHIDGQRSTEEEKKESSLEYFLTQNEKLNIFKPRDDFIDTSNSIDDYNNYVNLSEENDIKQMSFKNYISNNRVHDHPKRHSKRKRVQCEKCLNSQNVFLSEEELTDLRIEFVKKQILEKLRLKAPPSISPSEVPQPIRESIRNSYEDNSNEKELDDYYARTSKKFIILEKENDQCSRNQNLSDLNQNPSICFTFRIDDVEMEGIDVTTAVLWIYKKHNIHHSLTQTLYISEVEVDDSNNGFLIKERPLGIHTADVEGWIKIDIELHLKRWYSNHDARHILKLSCESCSHDDIYPDLISTSTGEMPYIVIDVRKRNVLSRPRRSVNCTGGGNECCREKIYISFEDIGWSDWIISPRGYNAYFCRGSCSGIASITQMETYHSSILTRLQKYRQETGKKPLEISPCCSPKKYKSLELLLFLDKNNTATQKTLPNMVVESCGC